MKNIKTLKGAKVLSKNEQRKIKGGKEACDSIHLCHDLWDMCLGGICVQLPPEMEL